MSAAHEDINRPPVPPVEPPVGPGPPAKPLPPVKPIIENEIRGVVYRITDYEAAFTTIIYQKEPPGGGSYEPWAGATVTIWYFAFERELGYIQLASKSTVTDRAGSFSFPQISFPGNFGPVNMVNLLITYGVPIYRSGNIPNSRATSKSLNIWVYNDHPQASDGVEAGALSSIIGTNQLKGSTKVTTSTTGITFDGHDADTGLISIKFAISLTPDTSQNLEEFLDINVVNNNISVPFPLDVIGFTAPEVLDKVKNGISNAAAQLNAGMLERMANDLHQDEGLKLTLDQCRTLLEQQTSTTFAGVYYPDPGYEWLLSATKDQTNVLMANPCIGYPRDWTSEAD